MQPAELKTDFAFRTAVLYFLFKQLELGFSSVKSKLNVEVVSPCAISLLEKLKNMKKITH